MTAYQHRVLNTALFAVAIVFGMASLGYTTYTKHTVEDCSNVCYEKLMENRFTPFKFVDKG